MTLLTVKELVDKLKVKPKTIYAWATQGKIPTLKINGVIRFDAQQVEMWLKNCQTAVGMHSKSAIDRRRYKGSDDVDTLIETAKRAAYTSRGETRPIASPKGKEALNGAR